MTIAYEKEGLGAGAVAQWYSSCLAFLRHWIQSQKDRKEKNVKIHT
jgi:hypothetical protein